MWFRMMCGPPGTRERSYGKGAMIAVSPANNAVAPAVPRRLYMAPAKGNVAAKVKRSALLLAIAEAAIGR